MQPNEFLQLLIDKHIRAFKAVLDNPYSGEQASLWHRVLTLVEHCDEEYDCPEECAEFDPETN
jgi:hypothetical protein